METINFVIASYRGRKFFQIKTAEKSMMLYQLSASWFGGERCFNKCAVKRNGTIIDIGCISHEGTQGASQFFSGFTKIYTKETFKYLDPKNLELEDILEIENISGQHLQYYPDNNEFIKYVAILEGFNPKKWVDSSIIKRLIVAVDYNKFI